MENSLEVKTRLLNYIKTEFPQVLEIEDDDYFADHDLLSSFEIINLILGLEDLFRVKITDDELTEQNIGSIQNIVSFITNKVNK